MRRPSSNALLLAAALAAASGGALAKSSDRNQPMTIDADWSSCGLGGNMSCEMRGKVVITQGTLKINAAQGQFTQSDGRPSKARMTGGVTMNQQMDDGTQVNTRSSAVDYDFNTEIVVLTGNVEITQPRGVLKGERVVYNMKTGQVQSGGEGGGRVRMTIQPKAGG
ncbi:lipopolysaccharide transport periplasmic protein LptA [Lysobacter pythonis]|uniref:Lipopolysaccharide export system protein LptA n=1 Tax=Solilutibacter pythonis TaxID=2483112 RepID=A0A3M2I1S4_9GAMM|nr:lipopolysaccharide transport periplasmic protein LptA [Lysobacter pythonis]RMH94113.1 lipopolysaccharide transport periplasmic protein LptA [Lysobacter pythonis]